MSGQRGRLMLPISKAEQRADPDPPKTSRISSLWAVEPPVEVLFRASSVENFIGFLMVSFLINNEPFGAVVDEFAILIIFHRSHLDSNRWDEGLQRIDAFLKITVRDKLGMLARHEENVPETEVVEVLRLRNDLRDRESSPQDGIISGKSAVLAIIHALVAQIKRSKESHCFAEVSPGDGLALLSHSLELTVRFRRDQIPESTHERSGLLHELIKLAGKTHAAEVHWEGDFVKSFPKNGIASSSESCSDSTNIMANATNVLTQGIEINGSIKFSNDMIIDGKIDGEIVSEKGKVTIAENANIKGDVKAGEVKLYGKVEGTISSERCELKEKSFLKGDIKTKTLSMEEGATLQGSTQIGAS